MPISACFRLKNACICNSETAPPRGKTLLRRAKKQAFFRQKQAKIGNDSIGTTRLDKYAVQFRAVIPAKAGTHAEFALYGFRLSPE
jgi:hypothetical protein